MSMITFDMRQWAENWGKLTLTHLASAFQTASEFFFCQCTFPYFPHGGVKALNACHTLSTSGDLFSTFVCKHR